MAPRNSGNHQRDAVLNFQEMEVAIRSIDRRLSELNAFDINDVNGNDIIPSLHAIEIAIKNLILDTFGSDSTQYNQYVYIAGLHNIQSNYYDSGYNLSEIVRGTKNNIECAKTTLQKMRQIFTEKLDDAGRLPSIRPLRAYEYLELHPEIERQVGSLYLNGHYSEAVEKSVKVLNNLVRLRSDKDLDGTALMMTVFSKNSPIIKFNSLSDQSDLDEQMGFMYLYAGAVMGLRNPRAHKIINDDPERALEFIAFISLLAKMLDDAVT